MWEPFRAPCSPRLFTTEELFHYGEVKEALHRDWLQGRVEVIVATCAFGMGVHHGGVRQIFHYTIPSSLTALAQEWGRAGRDGGDAECVLLYSYSDKQRVESYDSGRRDTATTRP